MNERDKPDFFKLPGKIGTGKDITFIPLGQQGKLLRSSENQEVGMLDLVRDVVNRRITNLNGQSNGLPEFEIPCIPSLDIFEHLRKIGQLSSPHTSLVFFKNGFWSRYPNKQENPDNFPSTGINISSYDGFDEGMLSTRVITTLVDNNINPSTPPSKLTKYSLGLCARLNVGGSYEGNTPNYRKFFLMIASNGADSIDVSVFRKASINDWIIQTDHIDFTKEHPLTVFSSIPKVMTRLSSNLDICAQNLARSFGTLKLPVEINYKQLK